MWKRLARQPVIAFVLAVWHCYVRVGVSRSAAALSYFLILTLFPLLLCVHSFVGRFHLDLEQLLLTLGQFLPPGTLGILRDYLAYLSANQSPPLFWAGLTAILLSASAGLRTLLQTIDALYQVEHRRPVNRFLLSLLLSALFLLTIYLSVAVIFTGDWFFGLLEAHLPSQLAQALPLSALFRLWRWVRYLLLFCFVLLLVLMVYRGGIPRGLVSNRTILRSALVTALVMVACSALFSWFIGQSARYELIYGSLASLIVLLVWLYFCGTILLLGAVAGWAAGRPTRD